MTTLNKILLGVIGLLIVGFLTFFFYKEHQISQMQAQISTALVQQQQLADNITRSQAQLVSQQDLQNFAAQQKIDLDTIKANLATLQASVTGVNAIQVSSGIQNTTNVGSTGTTPNPSPPQVPTVSCNGQNIPCPNYDPFNYQKNVQSLDLNEKFANTTVPIGSVDFDASKQTPWSYNIPQRNYNITNVLGTDENERQYVYNKVSIDVNGKNYPVQISQAQFVQENPTPSFSFWNPRLFMSASAGVSVTQLPVQANVTPSVNLQVMSYGSSKVNPSISVAQVGLGYDLVNKHPQLSITPISFNIGAVASPVIRNTYIGPTVQIGTDKNVAIGVGIGVGF